MNTTQTSLLAQQFANRLQGLLTQMGYPAMQADRARALASEISMDTATTSGLLNGLLMPSWDTLLSICALTGQEPGTFLDASASKFPVGTHLVTPLEGGIPLVCRLPDTEAAWNTPVQLEWTYLLAPHAMGCNIAKGDFVINSAAPLGSMQLVPMAVYLLCKKGTYKVRQCDALTESNASFGDLKVPLKSSRIEAKTLKKLGISHFGEVAAVLRDYRFQNYLID